VTLVFCVVLLAVVDLRGVAERMRQADLGYWLLTVFFGLAALTFMARRWQLMVRRDGAEASWGLLFVYYLESCFFNLFLPSAIGGDLFRGVQIYGRLGGARQAAVNIFTERLIGVWSVCLLGGVGLPLYRAEQASLVQAILVTYTVVLVVSILLVSRAAQGGVNGVLRALHLERLAEIHRLALVQFRNYLTAPRLLAELILVSHLMQFTMIISPYCVGFSAHIALELPFYMLAMPIIWIVSLIPALGGTGPREVSFVYLLVAAGANREAAVAAAGLLLASIVARGLLGGLVALRRVVSRSSVTRV